MKLECSDPSACLATHASNPQYVENKDGELLLEEYYLEEAHACGKRNIGHQKPVNYEKVINDARLASERFANNTNRCDCTAEIPCTKHNL
jgi:hypothetical protein